ncbi:hypothetical protein [Botryobacter ruber]|uniref:hypothetical protein n=1 Tax=Botryobacter ruber TaxID=2171629 RepID=UPI000E0A367D|nr:hypothetical protein [Botryobacter ruber]
MKLTEAFTNAYAKIELNSQWKYIQLTWLQHTELEPLRNVLLTALKFAREEKIDHWLFDLRKLNYTMLSDQIWSANEYFPSFDLTLHHRLACVVSPTSAEMFPDVAIQQAIQQKDEVMEHIKLEIFLDMEVAKYWLFD